MLRIVPSQIVDAIKNLFGPQGELDLLPHSKQKEVRTVLALLDEVPRELINLPFYDYVEYRQCCSALAAMVPAWSLGDIRPALTVGGRNPVQRIRILLERCSDDLPPPTPEFPFIGDDDIRHGIEDRVRAAWIDFGANEWLGATTSGGVALEATLLWQLKRLDVSGRLPQVTKGAKALDRMELSELIDVAEKAGTISSDAAKQAHLARDARNLIHPGKVTRSGNGCNKSSALTALAAVYRVAEELRKATSSISTP
jgi:hypothetical protein